MVLGAQGAGGNAATGIEGLATRNGIHAYGVVPEGPRAEGARYDAPRRRRK